ncbi:unknown protein [Seminavis robusta]|uniref:Uncharacterized protein n=1 Tax=Seminavis robusta TaxID=568900 RepID=A0A9N8DM02_9STRA|nr:unknown protein [Seminavis robusta]|eukprot:Sro218_g090120.1 n/a (269) ;mRNA; f:50279-51182
MKIFVWSVAATAILLRVQETVLVTAEILNGVGTVEEGSPVISKENEDGFTWVRGDVPQWMNDLEMEEDESDDKGARRLQSGSKTEMGEDITESSFVEAMDNLRGNFSHAMKYIEGIFGVSDEDESGEGETSAYHVDERHRRAAEAKAKAGLGEYRQYAADIAIEIAKDNVNFEFEHVFVRDCEWGQIITGGDGDWSAIVRRMMGFHSSLLAFIDALKDIEDRFVRIIPESHHDDETKEQILNGETVCVHGCFALRCVLVGSLEGVIEF